MNAEQMAYNYLDTYPQWYKDNIDPMMIPFKELFTNNGYITLHSCSGHVETRSHHYIKDGKRKKTPTSKSNQWYIFFVSIKPIEVIDRIVNSINREYCYCITLRKTEHKKVIDGYVMEFYIGGNYNTKELYQVNKNIYREFEKAFKELN